MEVYQREQEEEDYEEEYNIDKDEEDNFLYLVINEYGETFWHKTLEGANAAAVEGGQQGSAGDKFYVCKVCSIVTSKMVVESTEVP